MLKGYRTVIFNIIMTAVMTMKMWMPESDLPDADSINHAIDGLDAAITLIWGVGNILLRAVTNTPVFKKENTDETQAN